MLIPRTVRQRVLQWCLTRTHRDPDFVIRRGAGVPVTLRWWIIPRNTWFNIYFHKFVGSDENTALHDHPWYNVSWLLAGRYREHFSDRVVERGEGSWVVRRPTTAHRVELYPNETCYTVFFTGPVQRVWGFLCIQGWKPWYQFVSARDKGAVGSGCEEVTA